MEAHQQNPEPFYKRLWFKFVALLTFLALLMGFLSDGMDVFDRINPEDADQIQKSEDKLLETPSEKKDPVKKRVRYYMRGNVINKITDETGTVSLTLLEIAPGKFKSSGQFSNGLCGSFEIYGDTENKPDSPEQSMHLKGQLDIYGCNFSDGSKATFEIYYTLNIGTDKATGLYIIDEIPGSSWANKKQTGQMTLDITDKEFLVDQ